MENFKKYLVGKRNYFSDMAFLFSNNNSPEGIENHRKFYEFSELMDEIIHHFNLFVNGESENEER